MPGKADHRVIAAAAANEALRLIKKTSRTQKHNEEPVYQSIGGHEYANKSLNCLLAASIPGLQGDRSPRWLCASQLLESTKRGMRGREEVCNLLPAHLAPGCLLLLHRAHPFWSCKSTGAWGDSPALSPHSVGSTLCTLWGTAPMFQCSSLATTSICVQKLLRFLPQIPAWACSGSLRMKDAVGGSIQPSPSGLWSPPLAFLLVSNQAEQMGRRGCNPSARALF